MTTKSMRVNTPHPHQSAGFGPSGPVFPFIQSVVVDTTHATTSNPQTTNTTHLHHIPYTPLFFPQYNPIPPTNQGKFCIVILGRRRRHKFRGKRVSKGKGRHSLPFPFSRLTSFKEGGSASGIYFAWCASAEGGNNVSPLELKRPLPFCR